MVQQTPPKPKRTQKLVNLISGNINLNWRNWKTEEMYPNWAQIQVQTSLNQAYIILQHSNNCFRRTHRHKPIHKTRYNLDTNDTDASKTPFMLRPDNPGTAAASVTAYCPPRRRSTRWRVDSFWMLKPARVRLSSSFLPAKIRRCWTAPNTKTNQWFP